MARELPKEWKYLDAGMVLGTILAILGIFFLIAGVYHSSSPSIYFVTGAILALLSVLVTIWMAYSGTKAIKKQI